jgi:hypothetical protein
VNFDPWGKDDEPEADVIQLPRTSWTADEIMAMDFPEPRWAVPGIVAEGVTLLAGAPKIGKSWLALNISTAVAAGGKALSRLDVVGGDVLYLALEDNPRRLQSRLTKVLAGQGASARLTFSTACEALPAGGSDRIAAWLESHPDARLVVVDVFARVRGMAPNNLSSYDADYLAMVQLKRLADRYEVAILVVHHTRKAASEDFLDAVSGTNGLAGAADAVLVLRRARGKADAELHVTGRDVEEAEYALDFDPRLGCWQLLDGPASDYSLGDTRKAILDYLRENGTGTPKQIATALSLEHNTVKQRLWRMAKDDQVDTDGSGTYFPITPITAVTQTSGDGYEGYQGYTPDGMTS